jgi:hypothetical protein
MNLVLLRYGFDHKVGAVANICICAEKNGARADGENEFVKCGVAKQKADADVLGADIAGRDRRSMILPKSSERLPYLFRVRSGERGKVRASRLDEVLNLRHDPLVNE